MSLSIAPHTTQHPVDTTLELVIAYPKSKGQAEVHKAGCAHVKLTSRSDAREFHGSLGDDWFDVAPCARLTGAAAKTCGHCNETFKSAKALAEHNVERSQDW